MQIRSMMFGVALSASVLAASSQSVRAQTAATRAVSLRFQPMIGAEAFACGHSYSKIGIAEATITPSDFAMYVHDVKLLAASGAEVPVVLDQDGTFQNGTVALLDFEDGSGPCSNGNVATHSVVTGSVPVGKYVGVSFTIGVPFDRNHLDLTSQPSPLSVTRMFWAWNSGHKFVRFDAKSSDGKAWVMHLGSGGCTPAGSATTAPVSCAQENQKVVTITQFDVDTDAIIADAGALLAGNGGSGNQVCMSSLKSETCAPMFTALGIPFNSTITLPQTFLRKAGTTAVRGAGK